MLEIWQLADHDRHYFLGQIFGVFFVDGVTTQPTTDKRCVQIDEPLPRLVVRLQTQALQQSDGSVGHRICSDNDTGLRNNRSTKWLFAVTRLPFNNTLLVIKSIAIS